jgi:hypothetical protein
MGGPRRGTAVFAVTVAGVPRIITEKKRGTKSFWKDEPRFFASPKYNFRTSRFPSTIFRLRASFLVVLAFVSVVVQSVRAAAADPVRSLRNE